MSGKDRDKEAPSLEPPTLFGRKRRKKAPEPAPAPTPEPAPPVAETTRVDLPATAPDETPTAAVPPVPPPAVVAEPEPVTEPVAAPEPVAPPAPVRRSAPVRPPAPTPTPEPTPPPLFADEAHAPTPVPAPVLTDSTTTEPVAPVEPEEPRAPREPFVTGMPAALLTGALVGLATVGLTWLGLRACEVARGTSSCGNPGFLLLIAILVAMVLLGSALLRTFRVPDPSSTSFLAVGLLTVLVLLFLIEVLFSWTMVIVIPLLAVGCFAASHWVTTLVADAGDDA
ncbi:hypothetical protein [Nocardioides abyssi]|uniref:Uncharacterized protein n=1 Tax=Nocardioides abyssi TaxID=3058370 RepID=A0ABT8ETA7_9ACTN|nr:hypothetical protein [Nocardioides abyssi]MDN4161385.1 hypothetical protein [Nocardioides abyssi]